MLFYDDDMDLNPRQLALADAVRQQGAVTIEELAQRFGVTLQTVRRDVGLLARAGLLARFHGGVRVAASTTENIAYQQRQVVNAEGKRRIGEAVARRVPDGCSLILNIGTTTEAIARALLRHRGLRVITNNLHVADILAANPDCEVIVAGGVMRPSDRAVVGEAATAFIRQFKVDIGVIGISGIEPDGTLRDYDLREVSVARAIIAQSREVWLAADSSKFERRAMVEVAHVSRISRLFTDRQVPSSLAELLRDAGVHCEIADTLQQQAVDGGTPQASPASQATP
ncbi:DeoR/GlpR family DNA-binding transcription regulator [Bordetella flabilis]|nr:DeoR/GlpR family DNA-binding transcription regulator [Bordetella flabilis]